MFSFILVCVNTAQICPQGPALIHFPGVYLHCGLSHISVCVTGVSIQLRCERKSHRIIGNDSHSSTSKLTGQL